MTSPTTERRRGLLGSTGFKAPVTVLAAGNIVQSGEQTIDGKAVLAVNADGVPDRVACVGMTDATKNGIWDVSTGAWTRSLDANQNYDIKKGTTVVITDGNTYAGTYWNVTAAAPITLGTTLMTWARALASSLSTLFFLQAGAGAVQRGAQDKMREIVSVKDFGALGDGATDDTAAIQAAMAATLSINGGHLYFPAGTYKITSALTIGLWTGWKITGNSRGDTFIRQATNNTPIFKFTKENAHSWRVSDLTLDWSNQQVAASTAAAGIYFDFDAHTGAGAYNWSAERINFAKGNRGFAVNSAATNLAWGCLIDDIVCAGTMTGSVVDFSPNPAAGQPNIRIGKIYCRADVIPAGVPVIKLLACSGFSIDHLEVNNALLGAELLSLSSAYGRVGVLRVEVGTYTTTLAALIRADDALVDIGQFYADSLTINPGGGNKVYALKLGGANADVAISQLRIAQGTAPITSGTFYATAGGAITSTRLAITRCSLDQAKLSDLAADPIATWTTVNDWVRPRIAADRGDVNVALVAGTDLATQLFKTTLTANRTVTLDNVLTGNLFNGMQWTVVRNAAVPGAFTLDVGGVKTIPANTNARVTVAYRRQAWELIDYVVLP